LTLNSIQGHPTVDAAAVIEQPVSAAPMPNPAELIRAAQESQYGPPSSETKPDEPWSTAAHVDKIPPEVAHSSPEDLARLVKQWMQDG